MCYKHALSFACALRRQHCTDSGSEENLQALINFTHKWCQKWRMKINESRTKIMHFRNTRKPRSRFSFKFGESIIETVEMYKYLGVFLDENVKFYKVASVLAESSGRALGGSSRNLKTLRTLLL